jgi:hypothetical protein
MRRGKWDAIVAAAAAAAVMENIRKIFNFQLNFTASSQTT